MIRQILKKHSHLHDKDKFEKCMTLFDEIHFKSDMVSKIKLADFEFFVKSFPLKVVEKISCNFADLYKVMEKFFSKIKEEFDLNYVLVYIDSCPIIDLRDMIDVSNIFMDVFEKDNLLISFGTKISKINEANIYVVAY